MRKEAGLDVHHLIEQRFAERLRIRKSDIPAVVLEREFHWKVTGQLFKALPTGQAHDAQNIWNAYNQVYGQELKRLDWLEAIWPYFERLGVQR